MSDFYFKIADFLAWNNEECFLEVFDTKYHFAFFFHPHMPLLFPIEKGASTKISIQLAAFRIIASHF